ncbi:glucose-6-phosphate dehydrogenase [Bacillus carboniphilus]|uniref:Glucose-6-phosphate 1-dehydrogenase n=1 Tax=Bacillus carboniphilus TaxID=86663 RepID=A0ABP3GLE9_9BACI
MIENQKPTALITIFGATGDLANRKLYPSLYHLYKKDKLDQKFAVIGVARRELMPDQFQEQVRQSILEHVGTNENLDEFVSHFYYHSLDVSNTEHYHDLKNLVDELDAHYQLNGNRVFYLAMAPQFFGTIAESLYKQQLKSDNGFNRLVIEKPFGHDYPSAKELNDHIRLAFSEDEIYRIDHYLGKEMVQNIEVIRFANAIFEPLWNNRFISNIQVTSSETLGVEDRGRYYEGSGALRDMVQNHMLQMVALLAMEPPIRLNTNEIRSEKVKVLRALRPLEGDEISNSFVRGQYNAGVSKGKQVKSYREEEHVDSNSNTETFVAGKIMIDNFRWAGVPIYIRTGKRLTEKSTKIVVQFKDIPMNLYMKTEETLNPNLLVIHIQPDEGITLHLNVKKSGQFVETTPVKLNFSNKSVDGMNTPEAYEKLLYDCLRGDATNFAHWDEVALSWTYVDPIAKAWEQTKESSFPNYSSGSMGPDEADKLLEKDGFHWWPVTDLDVENC